MDHGSVKERRQWCLNDRIDPGRIEHLTERLGVPRAIAQILVSRGITTFEEARRFFRPAWEDLYDPYLMADMERAVARLEEALSRKETVLIHGDYDVDGITAVSLLWLFLRRLGADVHYYIPQRLKEGYGLSPTGVDLAASLGARLLITVDCGITGFEAVEQARALGIDVVITDHHEPTGRLPNALAVLDPKRPDCSYPFKELAGVGVAFKLVQALSRRFGLDPEEEAIYIDLVALGSAADIVPLVDENRVLVHQGIDKINRFDRIGVRALAETAGLYGKKIGTGQLVFILAPRINAVGRLGDARCAVELLTTESEGQAHEIARILENENRIRKNIDEETYRQALAQLLADHGEDLPPAVVLSCPGWHAGVIGIVASRIVERVYRPTIMIAVEDGVGKGSARSIPNFDIYSAIKRCERYLLGFGGHKYAAGLTIASDQIAPFREAFLRVVEEMIAEDDYVQKIHVDAEITLPEITDRFIRLLNLFAPFGPQNMRPVFLTRNLQVVGSPQIVGKEHLKFLVRQGGKIFDVIGFGLGPLAYRVAPGESDLDMLYVIEENQYNGQTRIQLRVKDLR